MNKTEAKPYSIVFLKNAAITAAFAAIICIFAPISIPLSTLVPISLATLAVYICAGFLDFKRSSLAVIIYILIGAVGLPVFSGYAGGFAKLSGPTGGFIIGYIPLAFIISFLYRKFKKKFVLPLSMILGTAVLYLFGTLWFMYQTGNNFASAVSACVLPFLLGDLIKIIASCIVIFSAENRIKRFLS